MYIYYQVEQARASLHSPLRSLNCHVRACLGRPIAEVKMKITAEFFGDGWNVFLLNDNDEPLFSAEFNRLVTEDDGVVRLFNRSDNEVGDIQPKMVPMLTEAMCRSICDFTKVLQTHKLNLSVIE